MRTRPSTDDPQGDVVRRRLEALIAELEQGRGAPPPGHAPVPPPLADPAGPVPERGRHARRPLTVAGRVGGWVEDRLPPALQGRAHPGAHLGAHLGSAQFGLVALVVAVGLVLGAWWLVRSGGSSDEAGDVAPPRPVSSAVQVAPSASAADPSGVPSSRGSTEPAASAEDGRIVVDVVGKVRRPGIVVLDAGARVVDAVEAAGGVRPGVDETTVNMARLLTDGEQIVIGLPGAAASPGPAAAPSAAPGNPGPLVNLNTADQAALETLPGVGPVTAAAILEWRAEHGGFTSVDELLEVSGIGEATLAEIAPHATV